MVNPSSNDEAIDSPLKDEGPVKVLLRLTETAGFLRSTDGSFYAQVSAAGRREIYALRSRAFRDWLIDRYFRICREIPSDWSMRRVLAKLEATARFEGGTPSIFIRVGHDGNGNGNGSACYLDLADPDGQAVRIDPDGWSVVNNPGVHFRHPAGQLPLPIPSRDGSIDLLRPYVNLTDRDFRLLIVWMDRVEAATAQLEDSPLGTFLLGDAYQVPEWTGAPARLLAELTMLAGDRVAASPRWPKSPRGFTVELRRIAPQLRAHGIFVNVSRSHQGRLVSISRDPKLAEKACDTPNLMADEEFGPELDTQENLRHG